MEKTEIYSQIGIAVASIITWLASKRWVFPLLISGWNWFKGESKEYHSNNINASKEITNIKEDNAKVYESQINFLVNQLTTLESQLNNYQLELEKMREKILELNSSIYSQSLTIGRLKSLSCCRADCQLRQLCDENNLNNNK